MIRAEQLRPLKGQQVDYQETRELLEYLAKVRSERSPLYLNYDEFEKILRWKLGSQYGRGMKLRESNTDELIREVTGAALTITHQSPDYELELRFGILCSLRGVATPVASAVLALIFPEKYAVIDFRGWGQVFGGKRKAFYTISDYKNYLSEIRKLAVELSWTVQEVDHAIWEYDRRRSQLT